MATNIKFLTCQYTLAVIILACSIIPVHLLCATAPNTPSTHITNQKEPDTQQPIDTDASTQEHWFSRTPTEAKVLSGILALAAIGAWLYAQSGQAETTQEHEPTPEATSEFGPTASSSSTHDPKITQATLEQLKTFIDDAYIKLEAAVALAQEKIQKKESIKGIFKLDLNMIQFNQLVETLEKHASKDVITTINALIEQIEKGFELTKEYKFKHPDFYQMYIRLKFLVPGEKKEAPRSSSASLTF